jgi:hypothetical protein
MVINDEYTDIIRGALNKKFTIKEASKIQEQLDKCPTPINGSSATWRNIKTGAITIFTNNKK